MCCHPWSPSWTSLINNKAIKLKPKEPGFEVTPFLNIEGHEEEGVPAGSKRALPGEVSARHPGSLLCYPVSLG